MTWHDAPRGAIREKAEDFEAEGWLCVEGEETFTMDPPPGNRSMPRVYEVRYSEARMQYRAVRID